MLRKITILFLLSLPLYAHVEPERLYINVALIPNYNDINFQNQSWGVGFTNRLANSAFSLGFLFIHRNPKRPKFPNTNFHNPGNWIEIEKYKKYNCYLFSFGHNLKKLYFNILLGLSDNRTYTLYIDPQQGTTFYRRTPNHFRETSYWKFDLGVSAGMQFKHFNFSIILHGYLGPGISFGYNFNQLPF